jgi:transposase-like protein
MLRDQLACNPSDCGIETDRFHKDLIITGCMSLKNSAKFVLVKCYAKLCAWVEENIEETLSFYRLPRQYHKI